MKLLITFILLNSLTLFSQEKYITVEANASVDLPANQIVFTINLGSEDTNPKTAFDKHKEREKNLLSVIKEFGVPDSNINFSLLNINPVNFERGENRFITNQIVNILLTDINDYESFQIALLSNGIFNFSGQFSSSELEEGKKEALAEALKKAEAEGKILAENINKKLGEVIEIESGSGNIIYDRSFTMEKRSGLINIPQFVQVNANVKVKFKLID